MSNGKKVSDRPITNGKAADDKLKRRLELLGPHVEALLKDRYGSYPAQHPLPAYICSVADSIRGPEDKFTVVTTNSWESRNACALPNGTIFISDRLMDMIGSREELAFVLKHEMTHISRRHSERFMALAKPRDILASLGARRLGEYESDVRAMLASDESGVNPYGGIVLLNAFYEEARKSFLTSDIIHGSPLLRVLALHYTTRLVDLESLSRDLTPIPRGIGRSVNLEGKDPWSEIRFDPIYSDHPQSLQNRRVEAARRIGASAALYHLADLYDSASKSLHSNLSNTMKSGYCSDLRAVLQKKVDKHFEATYPRMDECDLRMVRGLLLHLSGGMGIPGMKEAAAHPGPMQEIFDAALNSPLFMDKYCMSGRWKLRKALYALVQEMPKGMLLENSPEDLIDALIERIKAAKGFEDTDCSFMLYSVIRPLHDAYERWGIVDVDWNALSMKAVMALVEESPQEDLPIISLILDSSDIHPRLEDTSQMLGSLMKRFSIPKEEAERLLGIASAPENKEKGFVAARKELIDHCSLSISHTGGIIVSSLKTLAPKNWGEAVALFDSVWEDRIVSDYTKFVLADCLIDAVPKLMAEDGKPPGFLEDERDARSFFLSLAMRMPHAAIRDEFFIHLAHVSPRLFSKVPMSLAELASMHADLDRSVPQEWRFGSSIFFNIALNISARKWMATETREEFFEHLKRAKTELGGFSAKTRPNEGRKSDEYSHDGINERDDSRDLLLIDALDRYSFDLADRAQSDELLTLCSFVEDYDLKSQVVRTALKVLLPKLDNRQAYDLLFNDQRLEGTTLNDIKERLIDEAITDPAELEAMKSDAIARYTESNDVMEQVGKAILADEVVSRMMRNKASLLRAMLMSGDDDSELKEMMLSAWEICYGNDLRDENRLDVVPPLDEQYERLFKLDPATRYALMQGLLVGERGVLTVPSSRVALVDWFFDRFIEKPKDEREAELSGFLKRTFIQVAKKADVPTLYFMTAGLIFDRMLQKPVHPSSWESAIGDYGQKDRKETLLKAISGEAFKASHEKDLKESKSISSDYSEGLDVYDRAVIGASISLRLARYVNAGGSESTRKLKPVEFVRVLAGNLGAPGVRFLQVLGLYVDLPPEFRSEFDKVYDSMRGQPKLSALHTIQREWKGMGRELLELRAPVGGGSLLTVYDALTVDSGETSREAVKVLNPNALFHTEAMCELLLDVFKAMDTHKEISLPMIHDIRAWVGEDISLEGALAKDALFRESNQGWSCGSGYSISVPISKGEESKHIKREEYVNGLNLTRWDELAAQGHDMRAIVATVAGNFISQMLGGLVHSDMHLGNIRIDQERKIHLLDRNYLIELEPRDREFIFEIQLSAGDPEKMASLAAGYFAGSNKRLENELTRLFNGSTDPVSSIAQACVIVRKSGYKVPLRMTLVLKNLLSLERMAKRAGFSGLPEALSHKGAR